MDHNRTIIKPPSAFSLDLKEIWQHRELLYFFVWRDIKVRYKQTFFGISWAVLQPLGMMLLFTWIFSQTSIARTPTPVRYELFVLSGLIFWQLFYNGVSHAADSMISNANIIKKIYFPRLIVPLSTLVAALIDFTISIFLFLILCLFFGQAISWQVIIYFPAALVICLMSGFGLGTLLGALNVKYRDFRYALPFLLQLLFFASQVIYPLSMIGNDEIRMVLGLNPMNAVIELFRLSFGNATGASAGLIVTGTVSALVLAISGLVYFKKTETYFADII